jgi:hypothetical protein
MKLRLVFILIFLFPTLSIEAQTDTVIVKKSDLHRHYLIQGMYQKGYVFPTNDFLKGNNYQSVKIDAFQVFALKCSKQTTGKKQWEQLYRFPDWGVGISVTDFYNPMEIGNPIGIYAFLNAPFVRRQKLTFNYELGFGATCNWNSFNPVTNRFNQSIGAGQSFLIEAGLNLVYQLSKKIDLSGGFSLTHFSNGALKKPNFGINTIAPKIALNYHFNDRPPFEKREIPKYTKQNEWLFSFFAGEKNVIFDSVNIDIMEKYEGVFFPVFGVSTTFNRQLSYKSKIGIGMTASYDGSVNAQIAVDNNELDVEGENFKDKLQLSIYPSYELVVNKMSLILQPAFYLYRKSTKNASPLFHQRIGLKYQFTDHFFAGITLRDYAFHVSDFIEWTVGYRIRGK